MTGPRENARLAHRSEAIPGFRHANRGGTPRLVRRSIALQPPGVNWRVAVRAGSPVHQVSTNIRKKALNPKRITKRKTRAADRSGTAPILLMDKKNSEFRLTRMVRRGANGLPERAGTRTE